MPKVKVESQIINNKTNRKGKKLGSSNQKDIISDFNKMKKKGKSLQEIREFLIGEDYHPDDIEEMVSTFGKEPEYEEVVGQRGTKGCNIWAKGMQVYNKSKVLFGDIIHKSDKTVRVKLYKRGKITNKEDVWDCNDVSQTKFTEKVNAKRGLSKIKRSKTILRIPYGKGRLKTQDGMKNQQQDTIERSVKGKRQNEKGRKARDKRESDERNRKNRKMISSIGKYDPRKSSRYQDLKF